MEKISLVPLDSARRFELLKWWLHLPHVAAWWGPHETAAALAPQNGDQCRLIVAGDQPVGFITWHRITRAELDAAARHQISAGGIDFDLFIGEVSKLDRGIGPEAIRLGIAEVGRSESPPYFSLCTAETNERARQAFRKAGFTTEVLFAEGRGVHCLIMRPVAQLQGRTAAVPLIFHVLEFTLFRSDRRQ